MFNSKRTFTAIAASIFVGGLLLVYILAIAYSDTLQPSSSKSSVSYDSSYIILNTEDGTIDSVSLLADTSMPTVSEGQVAINAILNFAYAFDIETTINLNGTEQPYRAYIELNDAEFIWLYNTYFASPDVKPSELISPQEFLQKQTDSELYLALQQRLATIPPKLFPSQHCGSAGSIAPDADALNEAVEDMMKYPMQLAPMFDENLDQTAIIPCEELV